MSKQQKAILLFFGAIVGATFLGYAVATENYVLIGAGTMLSLGIIFLATKNFIPLLVIGILAPFHLPFPFVWKFPILLLVLGFCGVKYWLQGGMLKRSHPISTLDWAMGLFFGLAFLRYCRHPVLPNAFGWSNDVTGFREWIMYGLSFGVIYFLGRFVINRDGLVKLMRWLAWVSIAIAVFLMAAALSRSMAVAQLLVYMSMSVSQYDNGFFRLVALPTSGVILISLALLPNIFKLNRIAWWAFILLGAAAIVIGGNRATFATAFISVITILLLKRKYLKCAIITGSMVGVLAAGYVAGSMLSQLQTTGFLRVLALASPDLAWRTGGEGNLEWREQRWQRAMQLIREHPLFGQGYEPMAGAFNDTTLALSDQQMLDIDMSTGGTHETYLDCAMVLGIPALLLFVGILGYHIVFNAKRALLNRKTDPVAHDVHCFVCAQLVAWTVAGFVANSANDPGVWYLLGLGLFVVRMQARERQRVAPKPEFARPTLAVPVRA